MATTSQKYVAGVTCPACENNDLSRNPARNALSHYARTEICGMCRVRESYYGFFWRENAKKRGFELTEAGGVS